MPYPCDGGANFEIESFVKEADENFTVLYSILDADGNEVASACRPADSAKVSVFVPDTTNWDIDNPYLYTVTAKLQRTRDLTARATSFYKLHPIVSKQATQVQFPLSNKP